MLSPGTITPRWYWQRLEEARPAEVRTVDLESLPEAEREDRLQELVRQWSAQPFDVDQGSLARVNNPRLASSDHAIVLVISHLVADAHSLQLLARDIEAAYDGMRAAHSSEPGAADRVQYWD